MGRSIKFRVWDRVSKKYYHNRHLENGTQFLISIGGKIVLSDEESYRPDDFILEQYTGLKDKNGVEIYEGDIVRWKGRNLLDPKSFIVEFDGGSFLGVIENKKNIMYQLSILTAQTMHSEPCEVIGNIHEVKQ